VSDDRLERRREVGSRGGKVGLRWGRLRTVEVVRRRAVREVLGGDVDDRPSLETADVVPLGHLADDRTAEVEPRGEFADAVDVLGCDLVAHPLLGLGEQDLQGTHVRLALVDAVEVDAGAVAALGDEFGGGAAETGRAEVAGRPDQVLVEQRLVALDQTLLGVGVADLHRRTVLRLGVLGEVLGGEGGATEPVPSRGVADEDEPVAGLLCLRGDEAVGRKQADAGDVDERVPLVPLVEGDAPADRRDADAVAVVADPLDDPVQEVAGVFPVELAEVQRVEQGDRVRAHRERVTDDAADAGRGAVERVDVRRVVVALDAQRDVVLVGAGERDDGGVVARADDDVLPLGVERAQQWTRGTVRAVLAPEVLEQGGLLGHGVASQFRSNPVAVRIGESHPLVWSDPAEKCLSMCTSVDCCWRRSRVSRSRGVGSSIQKAGAKGKYERVTALGWARGAARSRRTGGDRPRVRRGAESRRTNGADGAVRAGRRGRGGADAPRPPAGDDPGVGSPAPIGPRHFSRGTAKERPCYRSSSTRTRRSRTTGATRSICCWSRRLRSVSTRSP
jgi:hypothetical protein